MKSFFLLILAATVSALVIPASWRLAPYIGMIDLPDARKVHHVPIPRVGGWGIVAGCLIPLLLVQPLDPLLLSYVAGGLVLFAFGAWDDARQVGHWPKFVGQAIAVLLVVWWGDLHVSRLPFLDDMELPPAIGKAITMIAMIGVINAVNHSDGLDGLAAGETLLTLIALLFLGYLSGSGLLMSIALAVIGGTLGFLRYNTHPARVFMGDAGSQFLGFSLGFLVVHFVADVNPAVSTALPLLLLGLPIADIIAVLYLRASGGMNWFKATRNHVHHRLLDLGFSHFRSVVLIYSLQALLVVAAVLLRYQSDLVVSLAYLIPVGLLFAGLLGAERLGWRCRVARAAVAGLPQVDLPWKLLPTARVLLLCIVATVPATLLSFAWIAQDVPADFGVVALLMAVVVLPLMLLRTRFRPVAVRTVTFVVAIYATYLFTHRAGSPGQISAGIADSWVILLAVAIGIYVGRIGPRGFQLTPTDYLVLFAVIALAAFNALTGIPDDAHVILRFVTYSVVLFYAFEVISTHFEHWLPVLGATSMVLLVLLAVRGS
jgi:UDP-GlcNAc:undecaprenyl-phosphate GlcNAc-1-phosphate transferase